jgi:hypothetical protein
MPKRVKAPISGPAVSVMANPAISVRAIEAIGGKKKKVKDAQRMHASPEDARKEITKRALSDTPSKKLRGRPPKIVAQASEGGGGGPAIEMKTEELDSAHEDLDPAIAKYVDEWTAKRMNKTLVNKAELPSLQTTNRRIVLGILSDTKYKRAPLTYIEGMANDTTMLLMNDLANNGLLDTATYQFATVLDPAVGKWCDDWVVRNNSNANPESYIWMKKMVRNEIEDWLKSSQYLSNPMKFVRTDGSAGAGMIDQMIEEGIIKVPAVAVGSGSMPPVVVDRMEQLYCSFCKVFNCRMHYCVVCKSNLKTICGGIKGGCEGWPKPFPVKEEEKKEVKLDQRALDFIDGYCSDTMPRHLDKPRAIACVNAFINIDGFQKNPRKYITDSIEVGLFPIDMNALMHNLLSGRYIGPNRLIVDDQ